MELILTKDIHKGLKLYGNVPDAKLIDVRTAEEYAQGHIPGSINLPLNILEDDIFDAVPDMSTPIFLYCLSGSRSIQAAAALQELGYDNAASIGGIEDYMGYLEK